MNRNGNSAFLWLLIITYYAHFVHNWLSTIYSFEDLRPFPTLIFRKSDSAIDQGGTSAVKNGPGPDWPLNPYSLIKNMIHFFIHIFGIFISLDGWHWFELKYHLYHQKHQTQQKIFYQKLFLLYSFTCIDF